MPVLKKGSKQAKDYMSKIRAMKGTKKVGVPALKKSGQPRKTLTKDQRNYNKDVDAYKYFIVYNNKVESGWEYKEDANDELRDNYPKGTAKIMSILQIKRLGIKDPRNDWKYQIAGYSKGLTRFIEKGEKPVKGAKNYSVTRNEHSMLYQGGTFKKFNRISGLIGYATQKEIIIGKVSTEKKLKDLAPQVKLRISRGKSVDTIKITNSKLSVDVFKKYITKNMIETQEFFAVMYLNNANKCLGVYIVGQGGFTAVVTETRLILSGALLIGATALILCHNHPSGNLTPSDADQKVTKRIIELSKYHDINVLDHVIITQSGYFSFADEGMM